MKAHYLHCFVITIMTCESARYVGCREEVVEKLLALYRSQLLGNLRKAISTADKKICINYIKKLKEDEALDCKLNVLRGSCFKKLTVKLIKMKCYTFVYYLWKGLNKLQTIRSSNNE